MLWCVIYGPPCWRYLWSHLLWRYLWSFSQSLTAVNFIAVYIRFPHWQQKHLRDIRCYGKTTKSGICRSPAGSGEFTLRWLIGNKTKQKANTFNVMSAAAFCYKASPALAQYLLILVSRRFQCCLD